MEFDDIYFWVKKYRTILYFLNSHNCIFRNKPRQINIIKLKTMLNN